jgi:hypothetical protein
MSTDWIKMRVDLRTHPKVVRMAGALKADKLRVIGGLFAVWAIFDAHSSDGLLDGYTFRAIDDELSWKGFAQAMSAIGWLEDANGEGLIAPRFDEHNGQSAKRRAQETERKRLEREAEKLAQQSGHMSASNADKSVTREEKRREEEKTTPDPLPGFAEFWSSWPRSSRKGGKAECEKLWRAQRLEDQAEAIVEHVKAMAKTEGWTKQGGEFIPAPLVYLRGKRWDGAEVGAGAPAAQVVDLWEA